MTVVERPRSLADALDLRARYADAVAIAGGTDVMVEVNGGRRRPERMIDLTGVPELLDWERRDGAVRLGAGVPYARLISELSGQLPGLAHAARTVGSPQIRNRGTIGGNLATASPAGDALPPLVAVDAVIEVASQRGGRTIAIGDFLLGPKRTSLAPDELVVAVDIPAARGPQVFSRIGGRSGMTTSIASFALDIDPSGRVGAAIGAIGPTVLRAPEAEAFLTGALTAGAVDEEVAAWFGELCAAAADPVDDLRGTAAYRRHAIAVLARRAATWAMAEIDEADA
jgi:CO/xanthine dehydrogenase FAD-binding subunit